LFFGGFKSGKSSGFAGDFDAYQAAQKQSFLLKESFCF
jgi:hypothetical protein